MTGICPQHDILFDELTTKEHLTFFARIRVQLNAKFCFNLCTQTLFKGNGRGAGGGRSQVHHQGHRLGGEDGHRGLQVVRGPEKEVVGRDRAHRRSQDHLPGRAHRRGGPVLTEVNF